MKTETPLSDSLENTRIALHQQRTPAYGDALRKLRQAERLLRQVLPDWADEVETANGQACCEITNRDVVMIRDFLANVKEQTGEALSDSPCSLFVSSVDGDLKFVIKLYDEGQLSYMAGLPLLNSAQVNEILNQGKIMKVSSHGVQLSSDPDEV